MALCTVEITIPTAKQKFEALKTNIDDVKLQDINTKLKTARRILMACLEEERLGQKYKCEQLNERLLFYTRTDQYLKFKARKGLQWERTFKNWALESEVDDYRVNKSYEDFRHVIIDNYLNKRVVPTMNIIEHHFGEKGSTVRAELKYELKMRGFIWAKIPNAESSILIEKPEKVNQRICYLKKIATFRDEGRNIVYLEERDINGKRCFKEFNVTVKKEIKMNTPNTIFMMAGNGNGLINLAFFNSLNYWDSFIVNDIIPFLPPSSVIVMGEKQHHGKNINKVPNINSLKREMCQWLKKNEIPHDPESHKAELYTLIQKCKRKIEPQCYTLDETLKGYGHDILRRPYGLNMLNFFAPFWKDVEKIIGEKAHIEKYTFSTRSFILDVRSSYTVNNWKKCEYDLIAVEKKVYQEDLKMEEIIDGVMKMGRDNAINKSELGFNVFSYSDGPNDDDKLSNVIVI